jgi:hypothetical protein
MQSATIAAQQARSHYRHELRTLTYVTIDQANGGIVRNLGGEGVAVQAVAALRPDQRVRLRFELLFPRLRIETYGQVIWSNSSGQCGIRFVESTLGKDLPERTAHQINQWIFANLLEGAGTGADLEAGQSRATFGDSSGSMPAAESTKPSAVRQGIHLHSTKSEAAHTLYVREMLLTPSAEAGPHKKARPTWISRPISGQTLAWLVDVLVVIAALLLFALIFLSIAQELPRWPLTTAAAAVVAVFIVATYKLMFALLGGASAGARLAQASALAQNEEENAEDRFR